LVSSRQPSFEHDMVHVHAQGIFLKYLLFHVELEFDHTAYTPITSGTHTRGVQYRVAPGPRALQPWTSDLTPAFSFFCHGFFFWGFQFIHLARRCRLQPKGGSWPTRVRFVHSEEGWEANQRLYETSSFCFQFRLGKHFSALFLTLGVLCKFEDRGGWGAGEWGAARWGGGAVDGGSVNAFLAAALTRVMRAAVPIPAVTSASVLHSAAVGGSVIGVVRPL